MCTDASAPWVWSASLLSIDGRASFVAEIAADYEKVRQQHAAKAGVKLVSLEAARANRFKWNAYKRIAGPSQDSLGPLGGQAGAESQTGGDEISAYVPAKPSRPGIQRLRNIDLATLAEYIDWGPFFQTWDLAGPYPAILTDKVVGETATNVFNDAQKMLKQAIDQRWIEVHAVFGLFPAAAQDDTVLIYKDESRSEVVARWHGLRQQHERPAGKPNYCLSDFIADAESGTPDWIGAFAVSAGRNLEKRIAEYEAQHDDYHAIMLKAIADRFAEAAAEWLHQRVRKEYWAYAPNEALSNEEMIAEKYTGIRPAPGYPACPDHTAKGELFKLINPTEAIGLELTETFAMNPAAAVSGFYLAHPESQYFAVSKIAEDQMKDWAARAGFSEVEAKRWLAPIL
jgi:5-methyltetrahydrofolate--homocysteine methyltransferase